MLGAVLLGLVAGVVARALMPGDVFRNMSGPSSWLASIALGLAGAVLGYLIFTVGLGIGDTDVFDFGGIISAIIGTVVREFLPEGAIVMMDSLAGRAMIIGEETQTETHASSTDNEILRVEGLVKYFPIRAGLFKRTVGQVHAVDAAQADHAGQHHAQEHGQHLAHVRGQ